MIVRQVSEGDAGLTVREIGAGTLAAAPEVGNRLCIELRRGRGLESSPVTHVKVVGDGQLAVKTERRIYVLSDIEHRQGPDRAEVEEMVSALLESSRTKPSMSEAETQYIRMLAVEPKEERRIRVMRLLDGEPELFGEGELLGDIELGESLRFTSSDGRILGTSAISMVSTISPSTLEVSTGNSRYRVEFLCGRLPG